MIEFSLAVWKHPNMAMHAPVSLLSDRARYVSAYTGHYNYLLSSSLPSSDGDAVANTCLMIPTFYFCFSSLVLKQRDSI